MTFKWLELFDVFVKSRKRIINFSYLKFNSFSTVQRINKFEKPNPKVAVHLMNLLLLNGESHSYKS